MYISKCIVHKNCMETKKYIEKEFANWVLARQKILIELVPVSNWEVRHADV